jgi:hypothetical protein
VQEASILQVGFATIPACIAANARCLLFHADGWKRVQNRTDVGSMIPAPPATANDGARARIGKPEHQAVTLTICEGIMDTSIERIRAKIAEMEAKLSNLRIAERELFLRQPEYSEVRRLALSCSGRVVTVPFARAIILSACRPASAPFRAPV